MAAKLSLRMGLTKVSKAAYASEPDFVRQMNAQMAVLIDDLDYIFKQFENVTPEITKDALEPTFEKSKVYCPKDTMDLVNSAYLEVSSFRGSPRLEMGYAKGGSPRYAVYVHEMTELKHDAPTRSKFLESAINEDLFDIIDRVADGYSRFAGM